MIKKPLERESISTTPKCFLEKAKDKRKKVTGQNSKKKVALEDKKLKTDFKNTIPEM